MNAPLILPSFDTASEVAGQGEGSPEMRLMAYEEGYKAGWDDALEASASQQARVDADLVQALQDMAFPYHEARSHVLEALRPLLVAMAERVLPEAARARFGETVIEAALSLAADEADAPVDIAVAPENAALLEELIAAAEPAMALRVAPTEGLGPGEAWLKGATSEREIDLEPVLAAIGRALDAFMTTTQETRSHG